MGSSSTISRVTWGLLGVVIIALIISITSLVLIVMDRSERIADLESRLIKDGENDKRFVDIESQMMSSTEQQEELEMKIFSLENSTDHTPPGAIAFSVGSEKPFNPNSWARIPMEIMIYNPAGYFGNDNQFHAPMKGVYSFHFGALSKSGKITDIHLYTQKYGGTNVHVARAYDDATPGQGGAAGSVMVQMDRGETASVWQWGKRDGTRSLYGGSTPYGPTTLFMGKLEYKLD